MGCSPGAPRLEGPHHLNNSFILYRRGGGGGGANMHNEGPQILLPKGPLKA